MAKYHFFIVASSDEPIDDNWEYTVFTNVTKEFPVGLQSIAVMVHSATLHLQYWTNRLLLSSLWTSTLKSVPN